MRTTMDARHQGQGCPLDYRYSPAEFRAAPYRHASALYIVGGLYGNPESLAALNSIVAGEPGAEVVFNGDFNWFNVDCESYAEINDSVLSHPAIRGNVETELARAEFVGCGCACPEWVADEVAERSDRIIGRLRSTARRHPELTRRLPGLPRYLVYRVAGPLPAQLARRLTGPRVVLPADRLWT